MAIGLKKFEKFEEREQREIYCAPLFLNQVSKPKGLSLIM
jgi:hypothetical protein